jgi:hypothetical protein
MMRLSPQTIPKLKTPVFLEYIYIPKCFQMALRKNAYPIVIIMHHLKKISKSLSSKFDGFPNY